jgi:lipoprotein-anchoring transpeptidase ErfK/SrfK
MMRLGYPIQSRCLWRGPSERRAVHETTPQNVGQAATAGCFHSWTPDIRELYEVARLDERVVVTD